MFVFFSKTIILGKHFMGVPYRAVPEYKRKRVKSNLKPIVGIFSLYFHQEDYFE